MSDQLCTSKSSPAHSSPMASDSSDSFTTVVSPAELRSARGRGGGPNNVPRRSVRNNRRSDPPRDQQKYLADLMQELNRINSICDSPSSVNVDFHHLRRLLILEIARVVGQNPPQPQDLPDTSHENQGREPVPLKHTVARKSGGAPALEHRKGIPESLEKLIRTIPGYVQMENPKKGLVVMQSKLAVPREPRDYNYIGRILGPRGISVRRLESESDCSIFIRGRGSLKDPEEERRLRGTAQGQHLNEDLHVIIRAAAPNEQQCAEKLRAAAEKISQLLKPDFDEYKRQQLVQLAIINGTYRP